MARVILYKVYLTLPLGPITFSKFPEHQGVGVDKQVHESAEVSIICSSYNLAEKSATSNDPPVNKVFS